MARFSNLPIIKVAETTGSSTAYQITVGQDYKGYEDFDTFLIRVHTENSGMATLNVFGNSQLGAKEIVNSDGSSLSAGQLSAGKLYLICYSKTDDKFRLFSDETDSSIPTGTVMWFAADSAPNGFLKANGASLDTSTYSELFSVIGYTFGGSGNTFNLPDLRGEYVRGWDDGRGVDSGRNFGSWQDGHNEIHHHIIDPPAYSGVTSDVSGGSHTHSYSGTTGAGSAHRHNLSGTGHSHVYREPYVTPTGDDHIAAGTNYNNAYPYKNTQMAAYSGYSAYESAHTHNYSGTTGSGGSWTHHHSFSFKLSAFSSYSQGETGGVVVRNIALLACIKY